MNKQEFSQTVFVTDYTEYRKNHKDIPYKGVEISFTPSPVLQSFQFVDENNIKYEILNVEHNPGLLKKADGTQASQCECIFSAIRNDKGKPWMMFLEMKYCIPKNIYGNVYGALEQLKRTYKFLRDEKSFMPVGGVKPYFVISTPDCESLAPFEENYLDQDDLLNIKEEYDNAQVYHTNAVKVYTPLHLKRL